MLAFAIGNDRPTNQCADHEINTRDASHPPLSWLVVSVDIRQPWLCGRGDAIGECASLREAVRFASAAEAIAATRHGAQPSLPTRSEVDAFLQARYAKT